MLDKNKVYVIVFKEDETGHISGDDPRVPPYLAANAFIEEFRGKMCLSYLSVGDEREHLLEGEIIEDLNNGIVFHAKYAGDTLTLTEFTMDEFEKRNRPHMKEYQPGSTAVLKTIDDVYFWCRKHLGLEEKEQ